MSSDLESSLSRLRPAVIDESLLARLVASADGTWATLGAEELSVENELRRHTPPALSPQLLASLEATLTPESNADDTDKIIGFPAPRSDSGRTSGWWRAAAAVALGGALAALAIPYGNGVPKVAHKAPSPAPATESSPSREELVPARFNRGLDSASDEGVIWHSFDRAHRVLKVTYLDRITLKSAAGRTYQVDQPRTEFILVPAKTD